MTSRIVQLIDEIEDYIDGCKFVAFSSNKIVVNKDEIDDLLRELKKNTPEEIKKYQKVVSNTEAILNDARQKAEALINNATIQTNELVSEHQIMQQAYAQANEIVDLATQQAQDILDKATVEANSVKTAAMQYTDDILANLEKILNHAMQTTTNDYNQFMDNLNSCNEIVTANRAELQAPSDDPDAISVSDGVSVDMI